MNSYLAVLSRYKKDEQGTSLKDSIYTILKSASLPGEINRSFHIGNALIYMDFTYDEFIILQAYITDYLGSMDRELAVKIISDQLEKLKQ